MTLPWWVCVMALAAWGLWLWRPRYESEGYEPEPKDKVGFQPHDPRLTDEDEDWLGR